LIDLYLHRNVGEWSGKKDVMGFGITVSRKGNDIYLTIKGDVTADSARDLLGALRNLLTMSLKCIPAGSQVTVTLKTRGTVDLSKLTPQPQVVNSPGYDEPGQDETETAGRESLAKPSRSSPKHNSPPRLTLIRGGGS
jgi:hypothetical protein